MSLICQDQRGIIIVSQNAGHQILLANPEAARLLGQSKESLLGLEFSGSIATETESLQEITRPDGSSIVAGMVAIAIEFVVEDATLVALRAVNEEEQEHLEP